MKSVIKKIKRLSAGTCRSIKVSQRHTMWDHLENLLHVFHDYYVPHRGNHHKPKIFHTHSVHVITFSLLALKLALVLMIFSTTPVGAWLSPLVEVEMVNLTNVYRIGLGEQPLKRNSYLDQVAQARAQDMINQNYFSHYSPDGKKPWQWVDSKQYNYDRFGENLAADFITAKVVFDAFKLSPSHDKNVRNPAYQDIGIATVSGTLDGRETNIMVVFYASLKPVINPVAVITPIVPKTEPAKTVSKPIVSVTPVSTKPRQKIIDTRTVPPTLVAQQATTTASSTAVASTDSPADVLLAQVAGVEVGLPAQEVISVATQSDSWLARLLSWSHNFYFLALISFLFLAAINIFVSYRVQHHSAIIASFFLVVLAGSLWALSWQGFDVANGVIRILGVSL